MITKELFDNHFKPYLLYKKSSDLLSRFTTKANKYHTADVFKGKKVSATGYD